MLAKALVFVNDAQAYMHSAVSRTNHAIQQMNTDSMALAHWAAVNSLKLNSDKTQAIIFGSQWNLKLISDLALDNILVYGKNILPSTEVKNLKWPKWLG